MTPLAAPATRRSGTGPHPWDRRNGPRTEGEVVDLAAIEAEDERRLRVLDRFVRAHRSADDELV